MLQKSLFISFMVFMLVSCDSDDEHQTEFEIAKAKWERLQFNDYIIQENLSCYCGGLLEWKTRVLNTKKDTVYFDDSKLYDGQTYQMVFDGAKTIEEAFDFIESFDTKKVASFEVEYDEQFGFPKSIAIDYIKNAIDDEITYLYTDFTPTK